MNCPNCGHGESTAAAPGVYRLAGVPIANPGSWSLRLEVLVDEFSRIAFQTELMVR